MIEIEPIGDFFEVDEQGYLINPCSLDHIPLQLQQPIRVLSSHYRMNLGRDLLGIYLRGSVPAGKAIPGVSDLDMLGLLRWNPELPFIRYERPYWADEAADAAKGPFQTLTNFDLAIAHHDPAYPGLNLGLKMVLKTQAICIWGEDVIPSIPKYKLNADLRINCKWIMPSLETWSDFRGAWPSLAEKIDFMRSFAKTLIRSGFELVMLREGRFTTDLYLCYSTFAKYHPDRAEEMRLMLMLFLNPRKMETIADSLFFGLSNWLQEQFEQEPSFNG